MACFALFLVVPRDTRMRRRQRECCRPGRLGSGCSPRAETPVVHCRPRSCVGLNACLSRGDRRRPCAAAHARQGSSRGGARPGRPRFDLEALSLSWRNAAAPGRSKSGSLARASRPSDNAETDDRRAPNRGGLRKSASGARARAVLPDSLRGRACPSGRVERSRDPPTLQATRAS